jgi:hypothetical protein
VFISSEKWGVQSDETWNNVQKTTKSNRMNNKTIRIRLNKQKRIWRRGRGESPYRD